MRIDISLRGITREDMERWVEQVKMFHAAAQYKSDIEYNIRYGDDWGKERK